MGKFLFALVCLGVSQNIFADSTWRITKPAWTASDERNYSAFVHGLGASGCNSITTCLKGPANPYRKTDPPDAQFLADCAKLPYILRGYFAWKNGLPFSYVNAVKPNGDSTDIRYTRSGNSVSSRRDIIEGATPVNGIAVLQRMHGEVDSAMFRMAPELDGDSALYPDFYSSGLNHEGIRPGTMIYDPAGHVAVVYEGNVADYYDYLRFVLAKGDLKYNPVTELATMMTALCQDIQDRVVAVQTAIDAGANRKDHPADLPINIYGTDGEWESYSTPSRDARLKTSFRELRTQIEKLATLYHRGSPLVVYESKNLGADLRQAYAAASAQPLCQFSYARSDKSVIKLTYDQVLARLFKLSFDLYHCPELRWGASDQVELQTCQDSMTKLDWYEAEQDLRNQIERTYQTPMGFSLDQLQHHVPGSGVDTTPDVDLAAYLRTL